MLQQARGRGWKKLSALPTLDEIQKRFFWITTMMTQVQNPWIPFKGEKFQMPFLEQCLKNIETSYWISRKIFFRNFLCFTVDNWQKRKDDQFKSNISLHAADIWYDDLEKSFPFLNLIQWILKCLEKKVAREMVA